jgi:hypothetical protein
MNEKYNEYIQKIKSRKRHNKQLCHSEWFWSKGIILFNTFLSLIAAIASVIALLK